MDREKPNSRETDRPEGKKPGRRPKDLHVYRSWCKRCGICAAFCPSGALEMGPDGPEWRHPEECIACRACELRCPDFAIEVVKEEEAGRDSKG